MASGKLLSVKSNVLWRRRSTTDDSIGVEAIVVLIDTVSLFVDVRGGHTRT